MVKEIKRKINKCQECNKCDCKNRCAKNKCITKCHCEESPSIIVRKTACDNTKVPLEEKYLKLSIKNSTCPMVVRIQKELKDSKCGPATSKLKHRPSSLEYADGLGACSKHHNLKHIVINNVKYPITKLKNSHNRVVNTDSSIRKCYSHNGSNLRPKKKKKHNSCGTSVVTPLNPSRLGGKRMKDILQNSIFSTERLHKAKKQTPSKTPRTTRNKSPCHNDDLTCKRVREHQNRCSEKNDKVDNKSCKKASRTLICEQKSNKSEEKLNKKHCCKCSKDRKQLQKQTSLETKSKFRVKQKK